MRGTVFTGLGYEGDRFDPFIISFGTIVYNFILLVCKLLII
jgi:hypothetical protein